MTTHLLFDLELVNYWRQLRQNLVRLLMVLELGSNQVSQVAQWLGSIKNLRASAWQVSGYDF